MRKFFVKENQIKQNYIEIVGGDFNHISNVLRLKINDKILISTQSDLEYICKIEKFQKDKVIVKIMDCLGNENEPNLKITLFQSLVKYEKMELIIQKCVEIGVDTIVPIKTDRCIVKIDSKEKNKIERWNKISEAAAKQSKRGKIPIVKNIISFKEALNEAKNFEKAIIPYEKEKNKTIKSFIKNCNIKNIAVFIGPEGGFSENEIKFALENNITPITLGKRILRTETAGFYTSIILLYEMED